MDFFFRHAKVIKLQSHHNRYLTSGDDGESLHLSRDAKSNSCTWEVEVAQTENHLLRLKNHFGRYIAMLGKRTLPGSTGRKVGLVVPGEVPRSDAEWGLVPAEGHRLKLKSHNNGGFLRTNFRPPPWGNTVSCDVPDKKVLEDKFLWKVVITELVPSLQSTILPQNKIVLPSSKETQCKKLLQSSSSRNPVQDFDERVIHYRIHDDLEDEKDGGGLGEREDDFGKYVDTKNTRGWSSTTFKGNNLEDLKDKLQKETGLQSIALCTNHKFNGAHWPLSLPLPPGNLPIRIVAAVQVLCTKF